MRLRDKVGVSAVLCPSTDLFISGDSHGALTIWDIRSQSEQLRLPLPQTEARKAVVSAALSHDLKKIAAVFIDGSIVVQSLDGTWSHVAHHLDGVGGFGVTCSFSPCVKFLVTGSIRGALGIFTVGEAGDPVLVLGHSAAATSVQWCPQVFDFIVSCSDDYSVRLWHAEYRKAGDTERPKPEMLQRETWKSKPPKPPLRNFTLDHFAKSGK